MSPVGRMSIAVALCLLGTSTVLAAPLNDAQDLAVDLGYGIYQGEYNSTTQLNVWRGYVLLNDMDSTTCCAFDHSLI